MSAMMMLIASLPKNERAKTAAASSRNHFSSSLLFRQNFFRPHHARPGLLIDCASSFLSLEYLNRPTGPRVAFSHFPLLCFAHVLLSLWSSSFLLFLTLRWVYYQSKFEWLDHPTEHASVSATTAAAQKKYNIFKRTDLNVILHLLLALFLPLLCLYYVCGFQVEFCPNITS